MVMLKAGLRRAGKTVSKKAVKKDAKKAGYSAELMVGPKVASWVERLAVWKASWMVGKRVGKRVETLVKLMVVH
eukprot:scaffold119_cov219-Ochromonas_danica.AAC.2